MNFPDLEFNKVGLVLVDLQQGYCKPGSDCSQPPLKWDVAAAEEICHLHVPFLEAIRRILPPEHIVWTQMEEHPDSYPEASPYKHSDKFVPLCVRDTPGHDFHIVKPEPGEATLFKTHKSAFSVYANMMGPNSIKDQSLETYFRNLGVNIVAFTGVIESRCVGNTLRDAFNRGFTCLPIRDLIAHPTSGTIDFETEAQTSRDLEDFFYSWQITADELLQKLTL